MGFRGSVTDYGGSMLERAIYSRDRLRRRAGGAHRSVGRSGDDKQCGNPDEAAADTEEHDLWIGCMCPGTVIRLRD